MFSIDFIDIMKKNIPVFLRKTRLLDFVSSLLKPLRTLNDLLLLFRDDIDYKLLFNGQVIVLEHYLNDIYDPVLRRIFISDYQKIKIDYLYNKQESKPKTFLYNKWQPNILYHTFQGFFSGDFVQKSTLLGEKIFLSTALTINENPEVTPSKWFLIKNAKSFRNNIERASEFDFVVHIPQSISFNSIIVLNQISTYKLAGKRAKIVTF